MKSISPANPTRSASSKATHAQFSKVVIKNGHEDEVVVSLPHNVEMPPEKLEAIRLIAAAAGIVAAQGNTAAAKKPLPRRSQKPAKGYKAEFPFEKLPSKGTRTQSKPVRVAADTLASALLALVGANSASNRRAFKPERIQALLRHLVDLSAPEDREEIVNLITEDLSTYQKQNRAPRSPATKPDNAKHRPPEEMISTAAVLKKLRHQSALSREEDVKNGRLIGSQDLAERLGLVRQSISAALKSHRFFAFKLRGGRLFYPAFFAEPQYDRDTLEIVSKDLGSLPAGSKWDFFTQARRSLEGMSPLEALRNGRVDAVRKAARAFAET